MRTPPLTAFLLAVGLQVSPQSLAAEPDRADAVIRAYLTDVAGQIGKDPRSLGGMDAVTKRFHELGEKHLLENKGILHKKAARDYLKLDPWKLGAGYEMKSRRDEMKQLTEIEEIFQKGGYGIPPYGRHTFATLWWDPHFAAKTLRELAFKRNLSKDEVEKRKFMEQYAAPRVYRQSDDPDKPAIAFFDGKELFVVRLIYTDVGIYALEKIEWFDVAKSE